MGEVKIFLISAGFPTGVENIGGGAPKNLISDGGDSSQNMGEHKMLLKNTSEGVHLIGKLPAISLQASK